MKVGCTPLENILYVSTQEMEKGGHAGIPCNGTHTFSLVLLGVCSAIVTKIPPTLPMLKRCAGTHRSRRLRPSLVDGGVVIWIWQLPELSCPPWLSPFELEQGTGQTRFRPALEARDTVAAQAHPLGRRPSQLQDCRKIKPRF